MCRCRDTAVSSGLWNSNMTDHHKITSMVFTIFIHPKNLDFHFKISGFSAAIKLADKFVYPDNRYPDLQTLCVSPY